MVQALGVEPTALIILILLLQQCCIDLTRLAKVALPLVVLRNLRFWDDRAAVGIHFRDRAYVEVISIVRPLLT